MSPVSSHFLPLSFWYPTPTSWFFNRGADYAPFRLRVTSNAGQMVASSGIEAGGAFEQKVGGQPFFVTGNWDPTASNGVSVLDAEGPRS